MVDFKLPASESAELGSCGHTGPGVLHHAGSSTLLEFVPIDAILTLVLTDGGGPTFMLAHPYGWKVGDYLRRNLRSTCISL